MIKNHFSLIFEKFKGYYNLRKGEYLEKSGGYISGEELGHYITDLYKYKNLIIYLIAITVAEVFISFYNVEIGVIIYFFVILSIFIHSSYTKNYKLTQFLRSILLIPIIRIISLVMLSFVEIDPLYWILLISILIFSAVFTLMNVQNLKRKNVGLLMNNIPIQTVIALTGILLGLAEYLIIRPAPLITSFNLESVVIGSVVLVISTGLAEELLFRGIIQKSAQNLFGNKLGLIFASLISTSLYIEWKSPQLIIFIFFVAMFYGYTFQKSKSIVGIAISHGLTNVLLFLILPFFL